MGLYIDNQKHPDVFKNHGQIKEPNQQSFRSSQLSEMFEEQQKMNEALQHSFNELKGMLEEQSKKQTGQWKYFGSRLQDLKRGNQQHKETEGQMLEWLEKLDDRSSKLQSILEDELTAKQGLEEHIHQFMNTNQEIVERLDHFDSANAQLELKVDEQLNLQKQIVQQMSEQEEKQGQVLARLENQEALTEKILRQIDHFRSILFERTSFLAEKIDAGYKITSSYIGNLLSGADKPRTQFLLKEKQKENE